MKRLFITVSLMGAGVFTAGEARAAVSVIGGGQAEACARAAIEERTELRFEQVCTLALETEALNPRDRAGTFVNRGVLKLRRAHYAEAAKDFDDALRIRPGMGEAYVNRGAAAIGRHDFSGGLADINQAIALGVEELPKAYFNRALAYEGLDDMKAAYFDYQKALELSPDWDAPKKELVRFKVSTKE